MTIQPPVPHSNAWYDRLATLQAGYFYPWCSRLAPFNGEDAYLDLVHAHLLPEHDVLDVGCGHGEVALDLAPRCHRILAYDRVPASIELAWQAARTRGITTVTFVCADSSAPANVGVVTIPAPARSFDRLISRRGPLHWLADARRVARPGAVLIQLNPEVTVPPVWNTLLPPELRRPDQYPGTIRDSVERRLAEAGLRLHSAWSFDVPEVFDEIEQFYRYLRWGLTDDEAPRFDEVALVLTGIVARFGARDGLEVRHRRLLWKAVVD